MKKAGQIYCCTECRLKGASVLKKEYLRKENEDKKGVIERRKALTDVARKAREAGMTYGKYVAMMEMKQDGKKG